MGIPESIEYFFLTIVLAVVAFFVLGIRAGVPGDTKLNLWTARAGLGALAWLARCITEARQVHRVGVGAQTCVHAHTRASARAHTHTP